MCNKTTVASFYAGVLNLFFSHQYTGTLTSFIVACENVNILVGFLVNNVYLCVVKCVTPFIQV